jgi:uncharacterized RDD family membrane protein YckC
MKPSDPDPGNSLQVSTNLVIETPENVVLSYRLAGPAARLLAFFVDAVIRAMILFGVFIFALMGNVGGAAGVSAGLAFIAVFLVDWGYFGVLEACFRGKSLGKHVFGLRVVQVQGYPVTVWGSLLRNLLRAADNLSLFGVAFVTMVISGKFRRLGDLVGQTVVIEERRVRVPREPIILEKIRPLSRSELGSYIPSGQTLALIEEFLSRRHVLTYRRGHAMAYLLARPLADRLAFSGDPQLVERYPMAFLAAVYATFYRAHEGEDDEAEVEKTTGQDPPRARRARPIPSGAS